MSKKYSETETHNLELVMVIALFDASGTVRDGKPYTNTYSWYLRMDSGQIVKAIAFFDSVEFNDFWARVDPAV